MQQLRPCTSLYLSRLLAIVLFISATQVAHSDEPIVDFLEGLRQRKYFDTALIHIEELSERRDIPKDVADTLSLERGITYRALGAASRIPEDREQALTQAELALKKFVADQPNHPRAAFANAELGQLLFDKARSLIWDSESPSNAARKAELQNSARGLIDQAKAIYQAAHDLYKAQYDSFPKFIDRDKDEPAFMERQRAQVKYLRAWFNLVRCSYERGQTFDKGTKERTETLIRASTEFEQIHAAYRKSPIGLQARLMMGKCFQEQDDINRALGIYNEMLSHNSTNATLLVLKSLAVQYRLICLNHKDREDFQLVIQEADTWLKDRANRANIFTETGLGIRWEKAVAAESLAKDRTIEADQKKAVLRQALADSKQVARFPSPYREPALAMGRRLNAELGEKDKEPEDFDTAFERARGMVGQIKGLQEDMKAAKTQPEKDKAQQAFDIHLNEIGRLFQLALDLRDERTDRKAMAQARYLLSYVFMRQRKSFDAYILAKYCMTRDKLNDPDSALSATEIAIEAAVQAFNDTAGRDQAFELKLLQDICELIISQYPSSSRGNEARMRLGQVYRDLDQPEKAAETYMTVPKEYSQFPSARMQAGQSYWLAWVSAMSEAESELAPENDSAANNKLKAEAEKRLIEGLTGARKILGDKAPPTAEMTAAEVSLATILNLSGKFTQTIGRLTSGGKNSILAAIAIEKGQPRPEKGIKSAAFAGQLYRLLLRAYVGTQQIDPALKTMEDLKSIGGQDTAEIYTQLGRELQQELERLKASGDTDAFSKTQVSFEKFLEQVNKSRDPTDYNSLLWIGETYFGLGQGVKEDPVASQKYFESASSAYQNILDNKLAEGTTILAIKLRQVRCLRAMGQYEQGVALAETVLAENANSLDVQFEAAYTLADWGADSNGQPEKLMDAMNGVETNGTKNIWGWSGITSRLSRQQSQPDWDSLKDRFLEARYELTNSRVRYARTGSGDSRQQLESAQGELTSFTMVYTDLDDRWFGKFNELYKDVRAQLGLDPIDLERPEPIEIDPADLVSTKVDPEAEARKEAAKQLAEDSVKVVPPPEGSNLILVSIVLALAAGGGFGAYKLMSKPQKKRRSFAPSDSSFTPPIGGGASDIPSAGDVPDFSGLTVSAPASATIAPPPRRKKTVAQADAPTGEQPRPAKKKRVATPEEAVKIRAARAAKAKAAAKLAAEGKSPAADGTPARRKVVRKKKQAAPTGEAAPDQAPVRKKKLVRKRPPKPRTEE